MSAADPDCLFCKIAAGEIPAEVVARTDLTVAFRDVNPQAPTHVLVIPVAHHPDAAAVARDEPEVLRAIFATAAEVAAQEGLPDYRAVFNTGAGAGQTVFHAHLHVLGGRGFSWPPG